MDGLTFSNSRSRPHAVVIGSGFGGLAAAVRLGARGWRVTVLERLDQPGGRARTFRQDGFTFDAGPTIVTAPYLFEELWALCGRRLSDDVELRPISPFYRARFDDGTVFNYTGDPAQMRAEVAKLSPGDVDGYERFMRASREICRVGFEQLGDVPFTTVADMVRTVPDLLRLGCWRSVHGLVAGFVKDERLRTLLSFHPLLIGGNPFSATAVYALIAHLERQWGVHYAMGGTGALVRGLARLIAEQGNALRCNADVREIIVRDGSACGVLLADGEHIEADIVISNADSAATYRRLLPAGHRRHWTDGKLARARYSMSLFVWYFGTRRRYEDVAHHTLVLGPRYKDLVTDIFTRKILAEDMSLYLHRPSATDPSVAPEGHDAFYVLSPVPHLGSGTDWTVEAERYRARVARRLSETVMPDLERNIVTSRMLTPLEFQTELASEHGAAFGLEPILRQSAWFRPHNRSEELQNLFLVGAGTHPGAGLPGVLSSARILDRVVPNVAAFV
jgi:phytoene desaturase